MNITLVCLDKKWFPLECCGTTFKDAKELMDHALPTHMVTND